MIRTLVLVLGVAASPLVAQICPVRAPFPTLPIDSTPVTPSEGTLAMLQARGAYPECAPPGPCGPGFYFVQSCDVLQWTFGDGTSESSVGSSIINHTYAHAGLYNIALHISNAMGSTDVAGSIYVASSPGTSITAPRYVDVNEAAGSVTVHVTRSGDLSRTNGLGWRLSADPNVMVNAEGTLTFAPGETDHALTFPITSDHRYGGIYYAFLYLNLDPDGAVAGLLGWDALHMQPTINVHEADPQPVGTISDLTVHKGEAVARVPLDLSGTFAFPCCRAFIDWRTIDGTARNGIDFVGPQTNGALNIEPDTAQVFIEIPLMDNAEPGTRSFDVEIFYADFPLARSRATVTIEDRPIVVNVSPSSLRAPAGSHTPLSLSSSTSVALAVSLSSSDRTVVAVPPGTVIPPNGAATLVIDALKPGHATITITGASVETRTIEVDVTTIRRRAAR